MVIKKEDIFEKYWDQLLPVDTKKLAVSCGIIVEDLNKTSYKDVVGVSIINKGIMSIYIDGSLHKNRQRFSIAHQLSHYVLGHIKKEPRFEVAENFSNNIKDIEEQKANELAIEILIPEKALRFYMKQKNATILGLATIFNVSIEVLNFRLKQLKII